MNPALIALHVLNKFLVQSLFVSTEYAGSRKNYTHYAMHLIPIAFKILILKKISLTLFPTTSSESERKGKTAGGATRGKYD